MPKIQTINDLRGKKVLLMGLGLIGGGVETAKWLVKQGARVTITDLKDKKLLAPSLKKLKSLPVKYVLTRHRPADFKRADLIVKNPDVPSRSPFLKIAQKHKVPIETDLSLFFKFWPGQIIGVTGTKGKSTTASLIYEILKNAKMSVKLGGNIGQTPLKYLKAKGSKSANPVMILELSSFQLEDLSASPQIAIITNLYPDHLNRHKTMARYLAAKMNILKHQSDRDFAILNYDNPLTRKMGREARGQLTWFTAKKFATIRPGEQFIFTKNKKAVLKSTDQEKIICRLNNLGLAGEHNLEHTLAAIAAAHLLNIRGQMMEKTLRRFRGLPNRLQLIKTINGVKYYNDTTATNPGATIAALKTLGPTLSGQQKIILLAGGADKNLEFEEVAQEIGKICQKVIMLDGTATPKFIKALKNNHFPEKNILLFDNFKSAIKTAKQLSAKGDIVLLSPACASFGMFKNEFDRGRQFVKLIKNL